MIESVSGIGSASLSAGVRSPAAAAAPTQGPSFEQALSQVIGSAVNTLQAGEAVAIQGVEGAVSPMKVVELGDGCAALAPDRSCDPRQGGLRLSRGRAHGDLIESSILMREF